MSTEAFDWLCLVIGFITALGIGAIVGAIVESWLELRRARNERLPEPNCRATRGQDMNEKRGDYGKRI